MKSILSKIFISSRSSDEFNDKNWHLHIERTEIEERFFESRFPLEVEVTTFIEKNKSKIDNNYVDLTWVTEERAVEDDRPGLFIAFIPISVFKRDFSDIGKPPEKYTESKVKLTIITHDEPSDKKSHPEWGCWLEVTHGEFVSWVKDDFD